MHTCPSCGLPMSYAEPQDSDGPPYWYCDGPNAETNETGCNECIDDEYAELRDQHVSGESIDR